MAKYWHRWRRLYILILAVVTCLITIAAAYLFWQPPKEAFRLTAAGKPWFTHQPVLKGIVDLFDLGVVDVNSDRRLDIYTANHSSGQFLLLSQAEGSYTSNQLSKFGLDQDVPFPGLEDFGTEPTVDAPGLYIYWQGRNIVFRSHHQDIKVAQGQFKLSSSVKVWQNDRFDVQIEPQKLASGLISSTVKFVAQSDSGKLMLRPYNVSIPIHLTFDAQQPLNQIYIGGNKVNPRTHDFTLYLHDRHGMAWTDLDGKELLDVFVVRGGLRGRMDLLPERYSDELLVTTEGTRYQNQIDQAGITKDGCPASQTAWIDFDQDGLLDIYTVCFTPLESSQTHPNQLYRQIAPGKFKNVAAEVNLGIPEGGSFAWFDADRDGDSDLFWADTDSFWLYVNRAGKFEPQKLGANPGEISADFSNDYHLTLADYDNDGDIDIFFASATASTLLRNNGPNGKSWYELIDPASLGLPPASLIANWVDYDNDGLTDLHLMPQGLYHHNPDHTFEATHLLEDKSGGLSMALATWLDADNNGTRDLLMATRYQKPNYQDLYRTVFHQDIGDASALLSLYPNVGSTHHWLELELVGLPGNRQAIGSQVELTTANGRQFQIVGQSEGSHYSQGHYRLYFGLGQEAIDRLKIFWADGLVQEILKPEIDQLLVVQREAAQPG